MRGYLDEANQGGKTHNKCRLLYSIDCNPRLRKREKESWVQASFALWFFGNITYSFIIFVRAHVHAHAHRCMLVTGAVWWSKDSFAELVPSSHLYRSYREELRMSGWWSNPLYLLSHQDGMWPAASCLTPAWLPHHAGSTLKLWATLNSPSLKLLPAGYFVTVMRKVVNTLIKSLASASSCDPPSPPTLFLGNK